MIARQTRQQQLLSAGRVTVVWCALILFFAGVVLCPFVSASKAALASANVDRTCVGDCEGGGFVTVDELVSGVNIVLGSLSLDRCQQFDCNGARQATVDCLLEGVNAALNGCAPGPTATATPTSGAATATIPPTTTPTTATRACGIFLGKFGSLGNHDGQFNSAVAVGVDGHGTVLVAEENHRVQKFACE